jgi:nucleoside-diphosphate-sugar epimerase
MNNKYFISGGAEFIGSHLVRKLIGEANADKEVSMKISAQEKKAYPAKSSDMEQGVLEI